MSDSRHDHDLLCAMRPAAWRFATSILVFSLHLVSLDTCNMGECPRLTSPRSWRVTGEPMNDIGVMLASSRERHRWINRFRGCQCARGRGAARRPIREPDCEAASKRGQPRGRKAPRLQYAREATRQAATRRPRGCEAARLRGCCEAASLRLRGCEVMSGAERPRGFGAARPRGREAAGLRGREAARPRGCVRPRGREAAAVTPLV